MLLAVIALLAMTACTKKVNVIVQPTLTVTATPTPTPSTSPSPSPSPSKSALPSNSVKFLAYGLHLDAAAEPGTDSFKVLVDTADANISVTLKGLPAHNTATKLCPIVDFESGSSIEACVTPQNGVAKNVPHGSMFKGVHVFQTSGTLALDVVIAYHASDRKASMRLPNIAPQPGASVCKDNGCNPFFEMTPRRAGHFDCTATWSGIASGRVDMETGLIAEKDFSAHGNDYHTVAAESGDSSTHAANLHITGSLDASTEAAVALRNAGAKLIHSPTVVITWP